ncbi:hypothetical protein A6A08_14020 [Nocardiopsis sp. TSRI0078]|uniref:hypothetical protein n=1 Tax=unclassified Nocardiopsis TaxID=2649073 RepID=UPI00093F2B75|nr:hypothetical protein [Nocardiopsis sp. TSRI0078]OKI14659.1 hypothetical protein A6A08_14020 [Nocardiopsis sp. TSRI0078]
MYGLIWRVLPGPWASKFIMAVGLLAGAAALLWFFAFPAISPHMPFNDGAVDIEGAGAGSSGGGSGEEGASGTPEEEAPPGGEGASEGGG